MPQTESYQDLVLGSGAGGKLLAWHLARSGRRVAVVERRYIGGSCPNTNCLPSKNEIWSAKVADLLHHAAQFGIVTGSVAVDMAKVRQRKREMVEGLVALQRPTVADQPEPGAVCAVWDDFRGQRPDDFRAAQPPGADSGALWRRQCERYGPSLRPVQPYADPQ